MTHSIYKITNIVNHKIYIGQTAQELNVRFLQHCKSYSKCPFLKNAIKKYGKDNFKVELVCLGIDQEDTNYWERHFIRRYNSTNNKCGYNLAIGGHTHHSEETKIKIGLAAMGRIVSPAIRLKLSKPGSTNPNYGKILSEETKSKISKNRIGKGLNNQNGLGTISVQRKLTSEQIKLIRSDIRINKSIANDFNVDMKTIRNIKSGKIYKDIL